MTTYKIEVPEGSKYCSKCKNVLSQESFKPKSSKDPGRLNVWCIACNRQYMKDYDKGREDIRRARQKKYDATPKGKLSTYKKSAVRRGHPWGIETDIFYALLTQECHWCGGPGGGVDRLDSDLGYCVENCVPCCKICNIAKNELSVADFLSWISRVAQHTLRYK